MVASFDLIELILFHQRSPSSISNTGGASMGNPVLGCIVQGHSGAGGGYNCLCYLIEQAIRLDVVRINKTSPGSELYPGAWPRQILSLAGLVLLHGLSGYYAP